MNRYDLGPKVGHFFTHVIRVLEAIASAIIIIVIIVMMINIVQDIFFANSLWDMTSTQFNDFLGTFLSLIVGLEFVILLTRHRAKDLVEVIMFAIARQIIVEHFNMIEMLVGVGALAGLFAIRKYLLLSDKEDI